MVKTDTRSQREQVKTIKIQVSLEVPENSKIFSLHPKFVHKKPAWASFHLLGISMGVGRGGEEDRGFEESSCRITSLWKRQKHPLGCAL